MEAVALDALEWPKQCWVRGGDLGFLPHSKLTNPLVEHTLVNGRPLQLWPFSNSIPRRDGPEVGGMRLLAEKVSALIQLMEGHFSAERDMWSVLVVVFSPGVVIDLIVQRTGRSRAAAAGTHDNYKHLVSFQVL